MVVPLGLAARRVMTELGEPVVKVLERGFALFQKVGDEALFALLYRLLLRKEFFNIIDSAFFRHKEILPFGWYPALGPTKAYRLLSLTFAN